MVEEFFVRRRSLHKEKLRIQVERLPPSDIQSRFRAGNLLQNNYGRAWDRLVPKPVFAASGEAVDKSQAEFLAPGI
jgi:hypothetical protein